MAFLDTSGRIDIIGAGKGYWDKEAGGAWFSNLSYIPYAKYFRLPPLESEEDKQQLKIIPPAYPQSASRMTLSPSDSPVLTGDSKSTKKDMQIYTKAGIVVTDIDDVTQVTNGWHYHGATLCITCLPPDAVGSDDLIPLYDDFNSVHICSQCGKGLMHDCH